MVASHLHMYLYNYIIYKLVATKRIKELDHVLNKQNSEKYVPWPSNTDKIW